jgi:hypothetical protein
MTTQKTSLLRGLLTSAIVMACFSLPDFINPGLAAGSSPSSAMSFEQQVQRLIDIEDIKILKRRYAAACDDDYNVEKLGVLFTEDAVWDGAEYGGAATRQGIQDFFSSTPEFVKFALHYVINPIIEVDGDTATGQWLLWQPMVMHEDDQAMVLTARYDEQYVRQDGQWLIKYIKVTVESLGPYGGKFGKAPVPETDPS